MKRTLFYYSFLVLVLLGCRQREPVSQLLVLNQGLENCNRIVQDDIKLLHVLIEERIKDPQTHDKAVIWEPRFIRIQTQADNIRMYIDSIKEQVIKKSDSLKESNTAIVKALYEQGGIGNELLKGLIAFKKSVPAFIREEIVKDSYTNYDFENREIEGICKRVPLLPGYADSLNEDQRARYARKWIEDNFAKSTPAVAMGVLNKIENDQLVTAKMFLEYCFESTTYSGCSYGYKPYFLASISSSYVKRGQEIEVTAGLGELQLMGNSQVIIDGKEIELKDYTTASHQFTATGKPGKHYVKVELRFSRPDGSMVGVSKKLEYIIAE